MDIPREKLSWEVMSHRGIWEFSLCCVIGMTEVEPGQGYNLCFLPGAFIDIQM